MVEEEKVVEEADVAVDFVFFLNHNIDLLVHHFQSLHHQSSAIYKKTEDNIKLSLFSYSENLVSNIQSL